MAGTAEIQTPVPEDAAVLPINGRISRRRLLVEGAVLVPTGLGLAWFVSHKAVEFANGMYNASSLNKDLSKNSDAGATHLK